MVDRRGDGRHSGSGRLRDDRTKARAVLITNFKCPTLRAAAPKRSCWKTAEFATVRLRLIKLAARVVEGTARIRIWLPTACPDAAIFRLLAGRFATAGP